LSTVRARRTVVTALLVALVAMACSSGTKEPQGRPGVTGTREINLRLQVTNAELVSPHQVIGPLATPTRDAVVDVLQKLFDATMIRPLTGKPSGPVEALFTTDAAEHANGADRTVIFDEDVPEIPVAVADKRDVQLTALAGDDNAPALVVARVDWHVRNKKGTVNVWRSGELSLIPAFGTWVVGAYTLVVGRLVGGETTTTTVTTG